MMQIVLNNTNAKITEMSVSYGKTVTFVGHLSYVELKAFLGLLYLAGTFKSNHEGASSLWATGGFGDQFLEQLCPNLIFYFCCLACV